jgi:hypothetical protein
LAEVFKICHTSETEANSAKMSNVRIALLDIVDMVPYMYNTNEGWVVKKMNMKYVNRIVAIMPINY